MKEFRTAIEARDFDAIGDLFADDIVFHSPVAFTPYEGRDIAHSIIRGVGRVFEDFRYVSEINDGANSALIFETLVDGVRLNGCDFITVNDEGKISELTVMVRPLSAANALAQAMGAQFEQIKSEAMNSAVPAPPSQKDN